ncbi:MAG TPA: hypothetical protein IAB83_09360 [Candidatus Faecousia faecavium]|nr:hypothetical protein [Candidatus Faecousia faecavium]
MAKKRRKRSIEFKPDPQTATWVKTFHLTIQQRLQLAKWVLYILTIVLCLVVQDVIMSRIRLFGATTDLAVCAILLITVIEGTDTGSLFVLIASTLYYFSGSAPGAYVIALMSFLGVAAVLLRQLYWHRSKGSIVLCTGIALMLYEIGLFVVGIAIGLTLPSRLIYFILTGVYSCLALIPLYSVIYKIGLIGGNTWKE